MSIVAQSVKNLPAVQDTWVQSLGWEDPLEKKMQPSPVSLPRKSHGQKSLVGCSQGGCKESGMTELLTLTYLPNSHQGMFQQRGDSLDDSRTFRERMDSPGERPWEGSGIHWQTVGEPSEGRACGLGGTRVTAAEL